MNVNTPPTQDVKEHMHVFKNVHEYWRSFPPRWHKLARVNRFTKWVPTNPGEEDDEEDEEDEDDKERI